MRAQSTGAEVLVLRTERADDGALYLHTQLRFDLSPAVQDAMARGIAVFFVADADIYRNRWYWYDKKLSSATRQWRLAYQPLTRRWRLSVINSNGGGQNASLTQSFESLSEALGAVQRTVRWKIAEVEGLSADADYSLDYRFRLDVTQLPRPFQIGAVGQSEWNVSADRVLKISLAARETGQIAPREPAKDAGKDVNREPAK